MAERLIPDHIPFTAGEIMKGDIFISSIMYPDGSEHIFWKVTARTPKFVTIVAIDGVKIQKDGKWYTYPIDQVRHTKCLVHQVYDEKSCKPIMQCYLKIDPNTAPVLMLDKKRNDRATIYDGCLVPCLPD